MPRSRLNNQLDTIDDYLEYLTEQKAKFGGDCKVLLPRFGDNFGIAEPACYQEAIAENDPPKKDGYRDGASYMSGCSPDEEHLEISRRWHPNAGPAILLI